MRIVAAAILALATWASLAAAEVRVALVIGNGAYAAVPSIKPLENPINDARAIARTLEGIGFEVDLRLDQTRAEMAEALRLFRRRAVAADVALIHFAGHGVEIDGRNFLIPVEARLESDLDVEFEAVALDQALLAADGPKRLGLVIVDACRDNPFAARMTRSGATRSIGRGLGEVEPSRGTVVAFAARAGTLAEDGEGENSPYATALIDLLDEPGLEIGKLFREVAARVEAATDGRQVPITYGTFPSEDVFLAGPAPGELGVRVAPLDAPSAAAFSVAPASSAALEAAFELEFWRAAAESGDAADLADYLARYPEGRFAALAERRIAALASPAAAAPDEARSDVAAAVVDAPEAPAAAPERMAALAEPSRAAAPAEATPPAPDPAAALAAARSAAEAEEARMGREARREAQRRLTLLGHDTRGVDGVFGPRSRAAIEAWQRAAGRPATGFLAAADIAALRAASEARFAAWRAEEERQAAEEAQRAAEEAQRANASRGSLDQRFANALFAIVNGVPFSPGLVEINSWETDNLRSAACARDAVYRLIGDRGLRNLDPDSLFRARADAVRAVLQGIGVRGDHIRYVGLKSVGAEIESETGWIWIYCDKFR